MIKELKWPGRESIEKKINEARKKFVSRDFKESLDIYQTLKDKNLISIMDDSIIKYCKSYIDN